MSYTAQLPLSPSANSTYKNIDELKNFVKQNVKNVLLTSPGERIMIPSFGVGLRKFLFENTLEAGAEAELQNNIAFQFERYLPSVILLDIKTDQKENFLLVKVYYTLAEYNLEDFLEIRVEN